ncbi:hypothetical protein D9611_009421 [Ephemerocybe angulata]|uniref:Uncharacterized protein n=1 Tax=Ephemerocybe angulata TaxID=980116 RepID=A0A8H5AWS9_9AGAR|nr:hypothetical protein D9611_009421 [Tulosesus angulatus]
MERRGESESGLSVATIAGLAVAGSVIVAVFLLIVRNMRAQQLVYRRNAKKSPILPSLFGDSASQRLTTFFRRPRSSRTEYLPAYSDYPFDMPLQISPSDAPDTPSPRVSYITASEVGLSRYKSTSKSVRRPSNVEWIEPSTPLPGARSPVLPERVYLGKDAAGRELSPRSSSRPPGRNAPEEASGESEDELGPGSRLYRVANATAEDPRLSYQVVVTPASDIIVGAASGAGNR